MFEAVQIMTKKPTSSKVIDFSAYKQQMFESQEVKMVDYEPCEQDIVAFLKVMRYLQQKTISEQVEVESNADGITISLTEFDSVGDDMNTIDYRTISTKTFIPFPFMLVNLDPSELTIHPSGQNTVELFAESLADMLSALELKHTIE